MMRTCALVLTVGLSFACLAVGCGEAPLRDVGREIADLDRDVATAERQLAGESTCQPDHRIAAYERRIQSIEKSIASVEKMVARTQSEQLSGTVARLKQRVAKLKMKIAALRCPDPKNPDGSADAVDGGAPGVDGGSNDTGDGAPPPPTNGTLIFHSGFEPGAVSVGGDMATDIRGIDRSLPPPNDWTADLEAYPLFGKFAIGGICQGANVGPNDHKVRITDDPAGAINPATGQVNKVLHMWNRSPDPSTCGWTTRPHSQIGGISGHMKALYFKFRLYLHSDVSLWAGCPGWLQIWETKRKLLDSKYFFGISLVLRQDSRTGKLYWQAHNRICCGGKQPDWRWEVANRSVPVPYDEWVTAEIYWQKGVQDTGRFYFSLQRSGEPKQVVFDVRGATVPPEQPDTKMYQWKMATVYASYEAARCVDAKGGVLQAYWDDWELWDGMLVEP